MILIDFSAIAIASVMMSDPKNLDERIVRHMILDSLRMYRGKFAKEFGELVICCDDREYWRKDVFPYYKFKRTSEREKTGLDWAVIYSIIDTIKDELDKFFPYKVIQVKKAEADDIIGAICNKYGCTGLVGPNHEKIMVVSGDKDFGQLLRYGNVSLHDSKKKKMVTISNPTKFLHEHIMRGDSSDSIPNFLSVDNSFVDKIRQISMMKAKLAEWIDMPLDAFCDDGMKQRYERNKNLIDLSMIPEELQEEIVTTYENAEVRDRSQLFNYFVKKKLSKLLGSIQEF